MRHVLLVGAAGSGMRGLGYLLAQDGFDVSGVDERWDEVLPDNIDNIRPVPINDALLRLHDWDEIIYSDAVPEANALRTKALKLGIQTASYHVALGRWSKGKRVIAIAGTHGKSSTTAFLAHVCEVASLDPSVLLGAGMLSWGGRHARYGRSDLFIVEADEYRNHFLELSPEMMIVTSLGFDHPDFFENKEAVEASFRAFIRVMSADGTVVLPESLIPALQDAGEGVTYLTVSKEDVQLSELSVPIPGEHMQFNATLALRVAEKLGVSYLDGQAALQTFGGLSRRFEEIGTWRSTPIISDYGHHPEEILATLKAARRRFTAARLGVILEVHTVARLEAFFSEFVKSLQGIDGLLLYPIFVPKGRERQAAQEAQNTFFMALQRSGIPTELIVKHQDLRKALDSFADDYDEILAFSAGDLDMHLRKLLA